MKEAVVFGCGETAQRYKDKILEQFHVIAYSSNHPTSWGTIIDGIAVIPPKDIPEHAAVVVASKMHYLEIIRGLPERYIEEKRVYTLMEGELIPYGFGENGRLLIRSAFETRPTRLNIAFSGVCNSRCQYCEFQSEYSSLQHYRGFISEEIVDETIRQIMSIDSLRTLALIGAGETLLHPQWQDLLTRILATCGAFEECVLYTNGMLLTKENAEKLKQLPVEKLRLVISIDGASPEDCEYWRKGERFSVIRENVHRAYEILGDAVLFLISGCVVLPASIDVNSAVQVEGYLQQSCEWRKKEFPFARHGNKLAIPLVAHIPGTNNVFASVFPKVCTCRNPFQTIFVRPNGDILSCSCGYSIQDYKIGNVMTDQLTDLFYHHEAYRGLRADISNRKRPEQCGECTMLGGNKILCLQRTE